MKKKLLSTAIGAGLVASSGLAQAWQNATTDYGFVPYVVKDTNRTTLVTVILQGATVAPVASGDTLHIQYWTKSTTDANTAACQPSSVTIPKTPNDVVTFDTAGILGYPLFGDTTNPAPLGMAISYAAPRHGFLFLENRGNVTINGVFWLELDLANGGAHGDIGLTSPSTDLWDQASTGRLSTGHYLETDEYNNLDDGASPVTFWPTSLVSTVFTVTPLGSDMLNRENNQTIVQVFNGNTVQGAYDRNENGVDGTVPITVRCVGRITPAQLMPGVVTNAAWAAQGGWGYFANIGNGDLLDNETQGGSNSGDLKAVVYQVDSRSAGGKFMINATRVVTNHGGLVGGSDIRLKRDIVPVGHTAEGFGIYFFRYLWSDEPHFGVMAQEVILSRPDAVIRGEDGFYRVDYGKLGLAHLLN